MEVLKELPERLSETMKVSRRSFLKGLGALSATAAIYGCGGGENLAQYKTEPSVAPQDNLVLDKELKVVMVSHPYNCGGRCMLKMHVKNGKMVKITSGIADNPRVGATEADESIDKPQYRPCLKGFAVHKRAYQPDRLKYPLKQTKTRGDLSGFKRISWTEAYDTIASQYTATIARKAALGYIPGMGGVFNYFGASVSSSGSPSTDNMSQALFGMMGSSSTSNALADLPNSKFILQVGANSAATFCHQFPNGWYMTKCKELGIPIVNMDPLYHDTASSQTSGYPKYNLPAYINPRMGSDAAIFAAMANVIYRKGLHDESYIKANCFGFYPGDTVVSVSTNKNPITGVANAGKTFVTPTGMSFVEYLDDLQAKHGGYNGVLAWAAQISGVSATIIENLGIAYGSTKPSFIFGVYGGAARGVGGYHLIMMSAALAAMTGNSNKVGGSPGFSLHADPVPVSLGATKEAVTTAATTGTISTSCYAYSKTILTGTDNRSYAQLRADVLALNKIDLGAYKAVRDDVNGKDGRLRIEMIRINGNLFNQRSGPMSKLMLALKKVKFIYGMDHFITPSLAQCDIVLPQTNHLEYDSYANKRGVYYFSNKVVEPMYECKGTKEINSEILKRLGINYGKYGPQGAKTDRELMAEQWAGAKISPVLLAITPDAKLPTFEEFSQQGIFQLPIPAAKAPLATAQTTAAGKFNTDTGRINFFSPYYFDRDKSLGDAYKRADGGYYRSNFPPKAMFAPPPEGFDPVTGAFLGYYLGAKVKNGQRVKYTLQHNHAHHRRRAHSVYDNVEMVRENFPAVASMNTADAAARGINNGDEVYVYNDWGCNKVKVLVSKRVSMGTVHIADGEWYRPSPTETYEAWFDMDGDGVPEKNVVPVDVGGAPNNLQPDRDLGPKEPADRFDNSFHGNFIEVSKTHPDK